VSSCAFGCKERYCDSINPFLRVNPRSGSPPGRYRVTAASSGTHTHTLVHEYRRLARALSGAPVCGIRKLPEGGHRDTGGDTGGGLRDAGRAPRVCELVCFSM